MFTFSPASPTPTRFSHGSGRAALLATARQSALCARWNAGIVIREAKGA